MQYVHLYTLFLSVCMYSWEEIERTWPEHKWLGRRKYSIPCVVHVSVCKRWVWYFYVQYEHWTSPTKCIHPLARMRNCGRLAILRTKNVQVLTFLVESTAFWRITTNCAKLWCKNDKPPPRCRLYLHNVLSWIFSRVHNIISLSSCFPDCSYIIYSPCTFYS